MTGPEIERVRVDLFRKARELGANREEAEDLATEALLCFYRWADGGEGSQLSHAITHARGKIYGWKGTGKAAKVQTRYTEMHAEDLPPGEWSDVLNRATGNPEKEWIDLIDARDALLRGDVTLALLFLASEFTPATASDLARRYGLTPRGVEKRVRLFRRYLSGLVITG
jgi:DNA-directed RNA polymerase specialized sigma24 family protein